MAHGMVARARFDAKRSDDLGEGPTVASYKLQDGGRARARLKRLGAEAATDRGGKAMTCECGGALHPYDLEREMERPKVVLCCERKGCGNSAAATARILRAELMP